MFNHAINVGFMCHVHNQNPVLKKFIPTVAEDNIIFARFG